MAFTNSAQPYSVVGVYSPVINVNSQQVYVAHKGGQVTSQKNFTTTSYSTSSLNFSCPPPTPNTVVDRLVYLTLYVKLVFDQPVDLGVSDGLRQWPIMSIMQNMTTVINNLTVTQQISDYVHALTRYNMTLDKINRSYSMTASMPDSYQQYGDWTTYGSAMNPLAQYGENSANQNRGALLPDTISDDLKTLTYTITEPLILQSPFLWDSDDEHMGFVNVNTLDFTFNLNSNLSRIWSHASTGNNITDIKVTLPQSPLLRFTFYQPPDIMSIPRQISYPYNPIVRYVSPAQTVDAGASNQVTTNAITLDQTPKRIYLFIRQQNSDQTFNSSDVFAYITNINITYNTNTGLLSTMGPQDLYNMCKKNGLNMSWTQFSRFCGSVIAIDFGTDIALGPLNAAGLSGQNMFQVTINYTNTSSSSITYNAYVVICNEGIVEVMIGAAYTQTGLLSKGAILESDNVSSMSYDAVKAQGGSIFGKLKSFVNVAAKGAQALGRVGQTLAPQYAPQLKALESVGTIGRDLTGGRRRRRYYSRGRGLVGGSLVDKNYSSSDIDEILQKYKKMEI